jgi:DNA polymerase
MNHIQWRKRNDMNDSLDNRELAALMAWQAEMGADEAILDHPVDRLAPARPPADAVAPSAPSTMPSAPAAPSERALPSQPRAASAPEPAAPSGAVLPPVGQENAAMSSADLFSPAAAGGESVHEQVARCHTLEDIHAALDAMRDYPLRRTATHTVHTDGHPRARVMLIGEAPGRDEDLKGRPFVGRSGRLLDLMLDAIGLSREAEDPRRAVLITNVVFWRPPGNRKPTEAEVTYCMPWLRRTIEIVEPEIIVCLGATPTQRLAGRTQGILRLRGSWLECEIGARRVPLLPTLHPAYLLRQPLQKRLAWRDFLSLRKRMDELGILPLKDGKT